MFLHAQPHATEEKPSEEIPLEHSVIRAFTPKYGHLRLNLQAIFWARVSLFRAVGVEWRAQAYGNLRPKDGNLRPSTGTYARSSFTPEYGRFFLNLQGIHGHKFRFSGL